MAGGIFPGKPFEYNLKCVIFTLVLAGGYWYAPPKNLYILFFLLWAPYIALAWYDYSYNCETKMKYAPFPFGRYIFMPFKPKDYQKTYDELTDEQKQFVVNADHLYGWTLLIVALAVLIYYSKI